ncbi:hypothetical protein PMIN05_002042 [Paraphaeosphaeria minitans]
MHRKNSGWSIRRLCVSFGALRELLTVGVVWQHWRSSTGGLALEVQHWWSTGSTGSTGSTASTGGLLRLLVVYCVYWWSTGGLALVVWRGNIHKSTGTASSIRSATSLPVYCLSSSEAGRLSSLQTVDSAG